ncbi:hypothetical protein NC653_010761 [Populus alba x Populus x berolinensis]|uniref:Uncharacterized protein n=1 Tax=Populus alba x Populus x berolinensis TaxID=444605 RepID=A0AAD6R0L2_9ROSI|nr:hypothetical protein NC653_010761 [Populus alba x Populus x berolinensis]
MPQKRTINKGERNSNRLSLSVSRLKTLAKTSKLIMANSKQLLILSFLAVAILVLSTLVQSSNASSSSSSHDRVLLARQRNAARFQIPSCSEMVSRSQCSHNPNCKWCKSEVLDDMCFSKAEAWRLPQQKQSCFRTILVEMPMLNNRVLASLDHAVCCSTTFGRRKE